MLEPSCEGAGIWFCMLCCPTSSSSCNNTQGTMSSPSPPSILQCHPDGPWFLLLVQNGTFYKYLFPIFQFSSGFCIVSSFPTAKVFTWMDSLEIQSGCLDSFVFFMLAPWDMVSRPPPQPPWHARDLTYMLVLYIKTWWQVLSHFFSMLLFYSCYNSSQVRLSSLTHSSSCSDIRGGDFARRFWEMTPALKNMQIAEGTSFWVILSSKLSYISAPKQRISCIWNQKRNSLFVLEKNIIIFTLQTQNLSKTMYHEDIFFALYHSAIEFDSDWSIDVN